MTARATIDRLMDFNPRAPYGARRCSSFPSALEPLFQSTCPVRGTTDDVFLLRRGDGISIHVPRTGHDCHIGASLHVDRISIHVPRTGHDNALFEKINKELEFQSTCPVRGTTLLCQVLRHNVRISIHVPRTGHDAGISAYSIVLKYFNPRAPYGARRRRGWHGLRHFHFNPRAPYGARHGRARLGTVGHDISIHVPRTGHDSKNAQIVFCIFAITDNKSGKVIM